MDAHRSGHHLRREDNPSEPPHRSTLGHRDDRGRCDALGDIFARRDGTRDGAHVAPPLVLIHLSAWKVNSQKCISTIHSSKPYSRSGLSSTTILSWIRSWYRSRCS